MSAETTVLQAAIKRALSQGDATGQGSAQTDQLSRDIAAAVDLYVQAKLTKLQVALVTPGTFVGAGVGTVVVTAPGLASYSPAT